MKRIAYIITDNGIDGRERTNVMSAYWDEQERDKALEKDKSKACRNKDEIIIDLEPRKKQALAKLNGIDKLVLGLGTHRLHQSFIRQ